MFIPARNCGGSKCLSLAHPMTGTMKDWSSPATEYARSCPSSNRSNNSNIHICSPPYFHVLESKKHPLRFLLSTYPVARSHATTKHLHQNRQERSWLYEIGSSWYLTLMKRSSSPLSDPWIAQQICVWSGTTSISDPISKHFWTSPFPDSKLVFGRRLDGSMLSHLLNN